MKMYETKIKGLEDLVSGHLNYIEKDVGYLIGLPPKNFSYINNTLLKGFNKIADELKLKVNEHLNLDPGFINVGYLSYDEIITEEIFKLNKFEFPQKIKFYFTKWFGYEASPLHFPMHALSEVTLDLNSLKKGIIKPTKTPYISVGGVTPNISTEWMWKREDIKKEAISAMLYWQSFLLEEGYYNDGGGVYFFKCENISFLEALKSITLKIKERIEKNI